MSIESSFARSLGLRFYLGECPPLLLTYNKNPNIGPVSLAHLSVNEYLTSSYVSKEQYESYFKFSIVRNPYDRIVSIYKHFQYHRIISFTTFLKHEFPRLEKNRYYFIKPQAEFVLNDKNGCLIDYIGKFEVLEQEFNKIKNYIKLPVGELDQINASLKEYNVYSRWNFRYLYKKIKEKPYLISSIDLKNKTSRETMDFFDKNSLEFVNSYYLRDFEYFDYEIISNL